MKLLLCFGTRPEWLKIKPLLRTLEKYDLLFTGQHPDLVTEVDSYTESLAFKTSTLYRINICDNKNRLDQLVSDCLLQFPQGDFDTVLVQGDTASAFSCALGAFHRNLKIVYLEAGLRTYNLKHPYPEEAYRQMISRISDINLAPTSLASDNLKNEITQGAIKVVGNTSLDNLLPYKDKCRYGNKVLVTLHRRENHPIIKDWFIEINKLAEKNPNLNFILPLHPNPNTSTHKDLLTLVDVIPPLSHSDLLDILVECRLVISDSGGIQEEGSFFNKKVIVCRKTTERPEGKDTGHLVMCDSPAKIAGIFASTLYNNTVDAACPYGDGKSAEKITKILNC